MALDTTKLLDGARIVDFTFQAAGAYGAMLLAGLGAEVIKIESEVHPDPTRGRIKDRPYQHSVFFEDVNLGKRSVAVNLKEPEGLEIVRGLIAKSDATMDNFRPGVLRRLGLDPADLLAQHPRLVVASLSAAGWSGPYSRLPGYAGIFNALSGYGWMTGYEGGPPTEVRTSMDMRTGAVFAMAVVGGLVGARRTGSGGRVDFSASEAAAMLAGDSMAEHTLAGVVPERMGNTHRDHSPHGVYPSVDGWLFLAVRDDREWRRLAELLEADGLEVDPAFATVAERLQRRSEVDDLVSRWTGKRDRSVAFDVLQAAHLPAAPAVTAEDLVQDPQMLERDFIRRTVVATTDRTRAVCDVPWIIDGRRAEHREPPVLGQDTYEVLHRLLGMDTSEVDRLVDAGALR